MSVYDARGVKSREMGGQAAAGLVHESVSGQGEPREPQG